jgi:hypothetical protein
LPIGPDEQSELWRAQARLGYSIMGVCVWSTNLPKGKYYVYMSRVVEKTAAYAHCVLEETLKRCQAEGHTDGMKHCAMWSDTGTHYRCHTILASAGFIWPTAFQLDFSVLWGLEGHMKGIIDTVFGVMQRIKVQASKGEWLDSIADVQRVLAAHFAGQLAKGADISEYEFIDFMPRMKKSELELRQFRRASLPSMLKDCHHWSFVRNDRRRLSLLGAGHRALYVSGIVCKAHIVPYAVAVHERTKDGRFENCIKLLPLDADAEEDEELDAEEDVHYDLASSVPMTTTMVDGWKLAYRKQRPECPIEGPKIVLKRLARKSKALAPVKHLLPHSTRHAPIKKVTRGKVRQYKNDKVAKTLARSFRVKH